MLRIWFINEPSSTIEFSTGVSSPPSVAVPPVRATTLTWCSSAKASTAAASCVLLTIATAAGTGIVYTPKMFCSLRKLSMLLCRRVCSSVMTRSAPRIWRRCSTISARLRDMVAILWLCR
ncbi:unannotated protein [freshwater metagenome]|uniref:Unannotated protein n=1 Tax=freshwater metagenome TaxID=449393 RepID=A0A6J7F2C4_9ZZZZ